MARAIFEYSKEVLEKVSFDLQLFTKEMEKAITRLLPHEVYELKVWVLSNFEDEPQLQPYLNCIELKN